ncbi:S8 family serine peptidase [Bradyrhizobium liaoningense]
MTAFESGSSSSLDLWVVNVTPETGFELMATAGPGVTVEPVHPLRHMSEFGGLFFNEEPLLQPMVSTASSAVTLAIQVYDPTGKPVPRAMITAYLDNFQSVQSATGAKGDATLTFFGGMERRVIALYVKPFADFWERWIDIPALNPQGPNIVTVQPLSSFGATAFDPNQPYFGWGQRLMGLNQEIVGNITGVKTDGTKIKVAIIDSGCDNSHPTLQHIQIGQDLVGDNLKNGWTNDQLSHGTHCAGIIAGSGKAGVRGFVPEAEIHVLKLFPNGGFDTLIDALAYCVANKIDVVNCSLGGDVPSPQVAQRIAFARNQGVAVFVAAGNAQSSVQFPASAAGVMAVAAIGQAGAYPPDTYHARTKPRKLTPGVNDGNNHIFAAGFTCFGPEIRVCAPGVAVISSVPGGGHAAWDGTSMACPHVAGLAAAVLAHHPTFQNFPRGPGRVDQLFQFLMAAAVPVGLAPIYGGSGLPTLRAGGPAPPPPAFDQIVSSLASALYHLPPR